MPTTLMSQPVFNRVGVRNIMDIPSTTSDVMGASAGEAWVSNPVPAVNRILKNLGYQEYTAGISGISKGGTSDHISQGQWDRIQADSPRGTEGNIHWYSRESADQILKDNGFTANDIGISDRGANAFMLDSIILLKTAERERNKVIERGSQVGRCPRLLAGVATSAVDPINIASAFLPFGLAAKSAASIRAAGTSATARAGSRALYGGVEGLLGAAVVEPLPLLAANMDLLNYTYEDSMYNLLYGAGLGGGMHIGLGYVSDTLKIRSDAAAKTKAEAKLAEEAGEQADTSITLDTDIGMETMPTSIMGNAIDKTDFSVKNAAAESAVISGVNDRMIRVEDVFDYTNTALDSGVHLPDSMDFKFSKDGAITGISRSDGRQFNFDNDVTIVFNEQLDLKTGRPIGYEVKNLGNEAKVGFEAKLGVDDGRAVIDEGLETQVDGITVQDLLDDPATSPTIKKTIDGSKNMDEAIDRLNNSKEFKKDQEVALRLEEQNIKDIRNILGDDATDEAVNAVLQAVNQERNAGMEAQRTRASANDADSITLQDLSDNFESPENLYSYDPNKIDEDATLRETVPEDLNDLAASDLSDFESVAAAKWEKLGLEDEDYVIDMAVAKEHEKELGRVAHAATICAMRGA